MQRTRLSRADGPVKLTVHVRKRRRHVLLSYSLFVRLATCRRYSLQLTAEVFRPDRSDGAARGTPGRNGRSSSQLVALAFSARHDRLPGSRPDARSCPEGLTRIRTAPPCPSLSVASGSSLSVSQESPRSRRLVARSPGRELFVIDRPVTAHELRRHDALTGCPFRQSTSVDEHPPNANSVRARVPHEPQL